MNAGNYQMLGAKKQVVILSQFILGDWTLELIRSLT